MHRDAHLSDHFQYWELVPNGAPATQLELYLLRRLCHVVLEPLREVAGCGLIVTDGRRRIQDHERYERKKLHPSPVSDHAAGFGFLVGLGQVDDVLPNCETRAWPLVEFLGAGAADVVPSRPGHCWTEEEYLEAKRILVDDPETPLVRQLIYYSRRGHFHVSNPLSVLLSAQAIGELGYPRKRVTYVNPD